ncbi:unnamed protein product [Schistocephalus solidus]|uniref:Endo/exonuclease/phosphatase domain-containing protein n=1 Tax=Schistocephalus solidus TaxID=70667 RepID=A0A183SER8_SCHSO|nr:unnamed protein product [Schistocephalus solidus]
MTASSFYHYKVDVCCLSEVQILDSGSLEIKILGANSHFNLYHSGHRDFSGRHGVVISLSKQANRVPLAWEPVNDWIVALYAPISAVEQREKETFYSQLQVLVERIRRRNLLIVAGDWNGRTGCGESTNSHVIGRFGLGSRCENGERPLNFAAQNQLFVTNTYFQHRNTHLLTWYFNDGHTASQIDYILVGSLYPS